MGEIEIDQDPESGEWSRRTDNYLLRVSAYRSDETEVGVFRNVDAERGLDPDSWNVFVSMAEFVREEPLVGEMRASVGRALRSVRDVVSVREEDTELWVLSGDPDGAALVRAVGEVVDALAPQAQDVIDNR